MPKARPETRMSALVKSYAPRGNMTLKNYEALRTRARANMRWPALKVDTFLAKEVNAGRLRVCKTMPRIGTPTARQRLIAREDADPVTAQQAKVRSRVERFVDQWCGTQGLTSPMLHLMKTNLRQSGGRCPTIQIEASVALMAAEGTLKVENRAGGPKGKERDWVKEAVEWAHSEGWTLPMPTTKATLAEARKNSTGRKEGETTIIELGSGWNGASEGLAKVFTRVITVDAVRQTVAMAEGKPVKSAPDIMMKFQDADPTLGPTLEAATRGSTHIKKELVGTWASLSCKWGSVGQGFQKGKQNTGPAAGMPMPKEDRAAIDATLNGLRLAQAAAPAAQYAIENPATSFLWKCKKARRPPH
jgi:hypothetical protein